jgi:ferredoxin
MADKKSKWLENSKGKFYVDDQCIACDACIVEAPRFFSMNTDEGHAFVKAQPTSPLELKECMEALNSCPVEAIGNDGDF